MSHRLPSLLSATLFEDTVFRRILKYKAKLVVVLAIAFIANVALARNSSSYAPRGMQSVETVTNLNSSGPGSLAEIISDPTVDTIAFDASLDNGTIAGLGIFINRDLTIDASNLPNGITLQGAGTSPVITILSGTVILKNLTITNPTIDSPFANGGIANFSTVTIENCYFTNIGTGDGPTSSAGVFNNSGAQMTLTNVSFGNITSVSGVRNEGTLEMRNVTLNNVDTDNTINGLGIVFNAASGTVSANHVTIY
ncbi:MAG: hypothetical protein AAGC88_02860, partial [Bacteroidota bacterium]